MSSYKLKGQPKGLQFIYEIIDFIYVSENPPPPALSQTHIDTYKPPPGWELGLSTRRNIARLPFFINTATRDAQWSHPHTKQILPPIDKGDLLPPGWVHKRGSNGQTYFYEARTSRATTDHPMNTLLLDTVSMDLPPNYKAVPASGKVRFVCTDTKVVSDSSPCAYQNRWCETYSYVLRLEAEIAKRKSARPPTLLSVAAKDDVFQKSFHFVMSAKPSALHATLRVAMYVPGAQKLGQSVEQTWLDVVFMKLFSFELFVAKAPGKLEINPDFKHKGALKVYTYAGRLHGIAIVQGLKLDMSFVDEIFFQLSLYQGSKAPDKTGHTAPIRHPLLPDPLTYEKMKAFMDGLFHVVPVELFTATNDMFRFKIALRARLRWHLLYKTVACLYGPASAVQQVVDLFAYWHPMAFPGEKDAPRNSEAAGGDAKQDSGIILMTPTDFCTGLWMSLLMLRDCNGPPKSNGRIAVNDSIPQTDGGPQGSVKASKGSRPSTPSFSFFNIRGEKTVVEPENQKVEYVAIKDLKDIFFWD